MKQQKKWKKAVFGAIVVIAAVFCVWKGIRLFCVCPCRTECSVLEPSYSEQDRVMKAIALSYLVYGCEGYTGLQGSVNDILDQNVLGIIAENFGIKRTVQEDPASAIVDTGAFVREQVGEFRFFLFCNIHRTEFRNWRYRTPVRENRHFDKVKPVF